MFFGGFHIHKYPGMTTADSPQPASRDILADFECWQAYLGGLDRRRDCLLISTVVPVVIAVVFFNNCIREGNFERK
jgi:hypothetical protein